MNFSRFCKLFLEHCSKPFEKYLFCRNKPSFADIDELILTESAAVAGMSPHGEADSAAVDAAALATRWPLPVPCLLGFLPENAGLLLEPRPLTKC